MTSKKLGRAALLLTLFLSNSFPLLRAQEPEEEPVEGASLRSSFVTDTATVDPGTMELDLGAASTGGFLGLPSALLFTPDVDKGPLHGTEFSVVFDAIATVTTNENRVTQLGDRVGFAIRRMVYRKGGFSAAIAPQALFFLREEEGARLGAVAAGVYHFGRNAVVANFVWSTATDPSEEIPKHQYDFVAGYSRILGEGPISSRFAVFSEYLHEFPRDQPNLVSLLQGVSFNLAPDITLDFAVQESGITTGSFDVQLLGGLAINVGRVPGW